VQGGEQAQLVLVNWGAGFALLVGSGLLAPGAEAPLMAATAAVPAAAVYTARAQHGPAYCMEQLRTAWPRVLHGAAEDRGAEADVIAAGDYKALTVTIRARIDQCVRAHARARPADRAHGTLRLIVINQVAGRLRGLLRGFHAGPVFMLAPSTGTPAAHSL
jgi:hypothetical protein